ncbi:MAG: hypothetical protein EXS42_01880 [Lacunisphaera sp.]|nr:hypothetical protein [Lacunisphaera sp.]
MHQRPGLPQAAGPNARRGCCGQTAAQSAEHRHGTDAEGKFSRRAAEESRLGDPRAAVQRFAATYSRPSLQWDDLKFLRQHTKLPVLLKGVLHPDDAKKAVELGIDGLVVSNHGGRQIDGEIGSLDALPAVAGAVKSKIPVLFDSGVRGGTDVFKALALGATAVCLGRPYVYGLAIAGQRGIEEVIGNVLAEFDLTLGLAGCTIVREVTKDSLVKLQAPTKG